MKIPNTALRAAFGTALHKTKAASESFARYLISEGRAAWVWRDPWEAGVSVDGAIDTPSPMSLAESLQLAAEVTCSFWYDDGQDAREARICPGLIAVGPEGIELAHAMNKARIELAASLAAMEDRVELDQDPNTGESIERPLREVAQEAFGAARLNYRQSTRCIVTLPQAPDYAGFTWANCRKVYRTSAGDVRKTITERLDPEQPDPLLLLDLKSLQMFSDSHPLALVHHANLTPKVNLAWTDESGTTIRTIKRSVLPLIYVGQELPARLKPFRGVPTGETERQRRSDVQLENDPFLATMPVHRYRVAPSQ